MISGEALSLIFLTQDFLGSQTYSINYYVCLLISELHKLQRLRSVHVFSHRAEQAPDRSILEVMKDYDIDEYPENIEVLTLDILTGQFQPELLSSADAIICTMYWWAEIIQTMSTVAGRAKLIYWVPSILMHEFVVNVQRMWMGIDDTMRLQKKAFMASDYLIFNSDADMRRAFRYYPDLEHSKCRYIYPVTRTSSEGFIPKARRDRDELSVGYFGRWEARKGIHLAIESFLRLFVRNPRMRLDIVSDYMMRDFKLADSFDKALCRKIERLVDNDTIRIRGWENRRGEYLQQLSQCNVVIVPSLYDPFNMVAYDCAVLRIPLVLSVFCGAEEVIRFDLPKVIRVNPLDLEEVEAALGKLANESPSTPSKEDRWVTYTLSEMVAETLDIILE